jgi:hypothetical protein
VDPSIKWQEVQGFIHDSQGLVVPLLLEQGGAHIIIS